MQKLLIYLLFLMLTCHQSFAQSHAGFVSQDSLLQLYYVPQIRWADSIVRRIKLQAVGHSGAAVDQSIRDFRHKNQTMQLPPYAPRPGSTAHSAVFGEDEAVPRKKRGKNHNSKNK